MSNPFAEMVRPTTNYPGQPKPIRVREPKSERGRQANKTQRNLPVVDNPWGLTGMECEVLRLMIEDRTATEAANCLCVSPKTVDTYLMRLKGKMGTDTRIQAILKWDRYIRFTAAQVKPGEATLCASTWRGRCLVCRV